MEKIKRLLPSLVVSLLLLFLSSCYRQTTIILPQGQTLPSAETLHEESTACSSAEIETSLPLATEREADSDKSSTLPQETKPSSSKPTHTQPPAETAPHTDAAAAETTAPVETTLLEQATTPAETTIPVETTIPAQTTTTAETTPPTEPLAHPVYDISSHSIGSYERNVCEEINRCRVDAGVSALTMSKKLSALAAIRAYECTKEFSHTRPDGRGWDTVLSDYGASASTENILYASSGTSAVLLIDTCIGANSHRQKILNSDYSTVGIGICDTGRYVFIVMIFC